MKTILLYICLIVISVAGCGRAPAQNDAEISGHISAGKDAAADSAAASSTVPAGPAGDKAPAAEVPTAEAASDAASSVQASSAQSSSVEASATAKQAEETETAAEKASAESTKTVSHDKAQAPAPRKLKYIDAWEEWHTMDVDPAVRETAYDADLFTYDDDNPQQITYLGDLECLQGIDVSEHQGTIDWQAVADAGYRFAFIRVGYRGYGEAGTLVRDSMAVQNLKAAKAAGLYVGTYFFSQALNEKEAAEEAELALSVIRESGIEPDLPLMYDPETIRDDWGRANEISRDQVALNTAAFCGTVESSSSCKADIYSNLPWEHKYFDADTMNAHDIWYADYEPLPQTPYHFTWWQYTNEGTVPGIEGFVDLNLWLREK